jgi:hypothetical protein
MVDEIFDRHYQTARSDLNATLIHAFGGLGRAAGDAFKVLNRIEYQAPWATRARKAASH